MTILKINNDKKVWITSDTHYSHRNMVRGITRWRTLEDEIPIDDTRDFQTLEEMDDTIVNNINRVVMEDDVLIHLGDWSFFNINKIGEFRNRINCKEIHLTLGNHDHHLESNKEDCRRFFNTINDCLSIEYMNETIEAMHYPIESWRNKSKGTIHLHGHQHLLPGKNINKRKMDIGIDTHPNFQPYDLMEVIVLLKQNPSNDIDYTGNRLKNIGH